MRLFALAATTWLLSPIGQQHNYVPEEGYVSNRSTAVAIARAVLIPIYGREQIDRQEPLMAKLDKGVWIVKGSLPKRAPNETYIGGLAELRLLKKDGRIIRVTHGK